MDEVTFVTYAEAQRLIPFFKFAKTSGPRKEIRESASRILRELGQVRDVDYGPSKGYQMFLREVDFEFYLDALNAMEGR